MKVVKNIVKSVLCVIFTCWGLFCMGAVAWVPIFSANAALFGMYLARTETLIAFLSFFLLSVFVLSLLVWISEKVSWFTKIDDWIHG